ncbi:unnamed protein product [Moneuplotes crassus]|uniref:Uncharacterized protein n=1 Tax=Euplotes crassus TaxID=5936 RepID=A0AAD2D472_EUPCR|nr:unnamed protein product [Moneuplotes crassus]
MEIERNFITPEQPPEVSQLKIVVVGEKGCGKTTICKQLCEEGKFDVEPTVGSDFYTTQMTSKKKLVQVNLWDLSGDKSYLDVRNEFYRDSDILLAVYDITNKRSFDSLDMWLREVSKFGGESLPVYLCGTKAEQESRRKVDTDEAKEWSNSRSFQGFCEIKPTVEGDSSVQALFERIVMRHM